jgi:DNA polymerase I
VDEKIKVARFARVYDILNAGIRKRYTIANKLISNCAFGIINGITEHGIVNYMVLNRCRRPDGQPWTLDDCVIMRQEWFKKYKGVRRFHERCMEETRQTGLARETIGGRVIYLPQIWSPIKKVRESAERMSYVMHTQGGGQTLIKKCMAVVWKEVCKRHSEVKSLLQMHDELLFELPDNGGLKREVDRVCVGAFCHTVKLRVEVLADGDFGPNWLEAH